MRCHRYDLSKGSNVTASTRWRGGVRRVLTLSTAMVLGAACLGVVATPAHAHARPAVQQQAAQAQMPTALQGSITPLRAGSPVATSVSRSADKLDVFGVDGQNRIYTTAWEPGVSGAWHRGTQINGGVAAPNTSVYAVSRRTDYLDVFAVGSDYHVYTAAWTPWSNGWQGWWGVGNLTVAPNTSVHAVSTQTDRIDLFAIGSNYGIYTNGWSPSTGWDGWHQVAGGVAAPGTTVYGVARHPGQLDIFTVGADMHIYTAARAYVGGAWAGWWSVAGGVAAANSSVFPVSRSTDKLDIFAIGSDHHIYTAAWEPSDGVWRGWWGIQGGVAAENTTVFGVSRSADKLDIFAVGADQRTYTAAWEPSFGASWHGWWSINGGVAAAGTSTFGVARSADHLDVFTVGTDFGLYSAAWEPAFGADWHGWWQLGNGQINGNKLTFSTEISLSGYDQGSATLTVWSNGNYSFSGHFHEGDKFSYLTVGVVWVLRSADGMAFTFSAKGNTVGTWIPGSSTFDWNNTGNNPALAAAWPNLQNGYGYNVQASQSPDFATMISDIKKVIGYVKEVVAVVAAL
jgi:hypothetical protein